LLFNFAYVIFGTKKKFEMDENMLKNNVSTLNVPTEIRAVIEEIINASNEKRIKLIKYSNPSIWQIIDEPEPESKKIYIQIIPKEHKK
jgi:hypothetical protein